MAADLTPEEIRAKLSAVRRHRSKTPKVLAEGREAAIQARASGFTVTEIAQMAGVSRPTVYDWLGEREEDDDG